MTKAVRRVPSLSLRETVAGNVRRLRDQLELRQVDLAKRSKLSRTYIANLERGRLNVSLATLEALAKALGVDPQQLLVRPRT